MNRKIIYASVLTVLTAQALAANSMPSAMNHGRAAKQSMIGAEDAYRPSSYRAGSAARPAGIHANQDATTVRGGRTPVVQLTSTLGDVGFEIFDGKTQRVSLDALPENVTDAIVYIDVDSVAMSKKRMQSVLKLARDLGWVVMAESGTWNVPRLHEFLATHYPGVNTRGLKNVAVRVAWSKGRAVATDLTPSDAAVEVGIDHVLTSEGQAFSRNLFSTKTKAPDSLYAWFANAAYQTDPSDKTILFRNYRRILNQDVVKVWKSTDYDFTDCIVAWRGSTTTGDWLRNIESQFGRAVRVPWQPDGNHAKIGHGYAARLENYRPMIDRLPCGNVYRVTGHSLGGGMAEAHVFTIRRKTPAPQLEAYNPARVGNSSFRQQLWSSLGSRHIRVYCRYGDPVWSVPVGLYHVGPDSGCTHWAVRLSFVNPIANHSMGAWL